MCKMMPVARRVLGECHELTLKMRWIFAKALYLDDGATLVDLREAVETFEETERTARRVLGGTHPLTGWIEDGLQDAQAALRARETPETLKLPYADKAPRMIRAIRSVSAAAKRGSR
jgi:hypothetical protein